MLGVTPVSSMTIETSPVAQDELQLIAQLRNGNEKAFTTLIDRYHNSMIRLAMSYVQDRSIAEEVTQEAWLGVIQGLNRFEGRSSLKTWLFRILINTAKTRGVREGRSVPFSALQNSDEEETDHTVEPDRFNPTSGHWSSPPQSWSDLDDRLFSQTTRLFIDSVIAELPASQRHVITMRDIDGWSAEEVCSALGVSEANQRVLLHRARARVRRALEQYLATD